jgi:predicted nucleic acid-binding protein
MKAALDTSVIVAALDGEDPDHTACRKLLLSGKFSLFTHGLSETFATLTGGRLAIRVSAAETSLLLQDWIVPRLAITTLSQVALLKAYAESSERGVRGGAIYDYLHLVAARQTGAAKFYTLNMVDFESFHLPGDPIISRP